jgi:hypothetical protein
MNTYTHLPINHNNEFERFDNSKKNDFNNTKNYYYYSDYNLRMDNNKYNPIYYNSNSNFTPPLDNQQNYKNINDNHTQITPNNYRNITVQPHSIEMPVILNTDNQQNLYNQRLNINNVNRHLNDFNNENRIQMSLENEDKDGKHLCCIIALTVLFGFFGGFYFCYNWNRIKRKELSVGVFLATCFISLMSYYLYSLGLSK